MSNEDQNAEVISAAPIAQAPKVVATPKQKEAAVQAATEDSAAPTMSSEKMQELLFRSLLRREEEAAKKEVVESEARIARQKQRAINTKNRNNKLFAKQARCTHLKGGRVKSKTGIKDYALFHHTYIDKQQIIGCFVCKMRWKSGDTTEYLIRNGRKKANHTRIGWFEALELFGQSSNTPSMSEIPHKPAEYETAEGEDLGEATPE
jgi:hypothetical protein